MLALAVRNTNKLIREKSKSENVRLGRFFTKKDTARIMAEAIKLDEEKTAYTVLDPGAGTGILSAAIVEHICKNAPKCRQIFLTCYETDPELFEVLEDNLERIRKKCRHDYDVRLFEIGLQILVSDDFKITMEKTEHKVFDGVSVLGEGSDFPIRWWKDPDGIANLLIEGQHIDNWEILSYDQDGIEVSGPFYRTGSCGFEIRGKLPGSYPLAICDGVENELRLEIQVAEDLAAAVESVVAEAYAVDRSAEHAALEAVVGDKVSLPAQASVVCYSVKTASGTVKFRLEDRQWHWNISKDQTAEELVGDLAENASETKTVSRGDITFKAYAFDDGVAVCWKNGNVAMLVTGESGAALSDALELAEQLSEANHG